MNLSAVTFTTPWTQIPPSSVGAVWSSEDGRSQRWLHRSDKPFMASMVLKGNRISVKFKCEYPCDEEREEFKFGGISRINLVLGKESRCVYSITRDVVMCTFDSGFSYTYDSFSDLADSESLPKYFTSPRDQLMVMSMQFALGKLRDLELSGREKS